MDNSMRSLEDKIQASKTTFAIYQEEIKTIQARLKEKGITIDDVEEKLDEIIEQIDEFVRKEKVLTKKVKQGIARIERKFQ